MAESVPLINEGKLIRGAFTAAQTLTSPDVLINRTRRGVVVFCKADQAGTLETYYVDLDEAEQLLFSDAVTAGVTRIRDIDFNVPRLRAKFIADATGGSSCKVDAFGYGGP